MGRLILIILLSFPWQKAQGKTIKADIPVNVGVGPAVFFPHNRLEDKQTAYYGLKLDIAAILDRETIRRYRPHLPPEFRAHSDKVKSARISRFWIPDHIIISPQSSSSYIYGASWRPLAILLPWQMGQFASKLSLGPLFSYLVLGSPQSEEEGGDSAIITTHFIRPGVDVRGELSYQWSKNFIASVGWSSAIYLPQKIGGNPTEFTPVSDSLWLIHQAFVVFHYRFLSSMTL